MTERIVTPDGKDDTTEVNPVIIPEPPIDPEEDTVILTPEVSPEDHPAEKSSDPKSNRDPILPNVMVQVTEDARPACIAGRWGFTKNQLTGSENWVVKFMDGEEPLVWRGVEEKYLFRVDFRSIVL